MSSRRKAFTLVELLVVMTVVTAIFGAMLATLHAMQKTSVKITDRTAATAQQQRFAVQLRSDAHQANRATVRKSDDKDTQETILKLLMANNQTVEYRLGTDRIARRVLSGNSTTHQETFAVRPVVEDGWVLDQQRPLVSVHLHQTSHGGPKTLEALQVKAALRVSVSDSSNGEATQ